MALPAQWGPIIGCRSGGQPWEEIPRAGRSLACGVHRTFSRGRRCLVLEGDHSYAAGTWAGAAAALRARGPVGLVWVDAHMDSHTPATTPSGAVHGMPLAFLLGHGPRALTHLYGPAPRIRPEQVVIVGVRSYEAGEAALLDRLGVRVIFMEEVSRRGLAAVMDEALAIARRGAAGFGISIDLDAVDPIQAPGVGSPVPGGLDGGELVAAVGRAARLPGYLGTELAEYSPALDREGRTRRLALDLMAAAVGGKEGGIASGD